MEKKTDPRCKGKESKSLEAKRGATALLPWNSEGEEEAWVKSVSSARLESEFVSKYKTKAKRNSNSTTTTMKKSIKYGKVRKHKKLFFISKRK